ncbi:type I-U CRISPR-associated protein Csb2 [Alkalinema pantanalense CENA528]|uniref:type I-G CRISPR-associated protein Csb2 n=1 Tax=Alkalinema pantanalense TaxID=1620705 RepID=UPI003D6EE86F
MTVIVSIQFLTGRYHATPWDKQVNEGRVEWPPSPWRILRSWVSAYYRLPERPERSLMLALMTALTAELPVYQLPRFTAAHTRHYMPLWKEGKSTTTKVLDTFYALPGGALDEGATLTVMWPHVILEEAQRGLLAQLCAWVSYLGRAESWVEMRLESPEMTELVMQKVNARPIAMEKDATRQEQVVQVLVPLNGVELTGFMAAVEMLPRPKKGRGRWTLPQDVLEMLELDVGQLHQQGWHGIPGSRWALYAVTPERSTKAQRSQQRVAGPAIARFALSAKVLPKITSALVLGERFHQALMKHCGGMGEIDEMVSGRDGEGQPLRKDHAHAWYLPECNDRGEIVNLVVYSPHGFQQGVIQGLQKIQRIWGVGGFPITTDLETLEIMKGKEENSFDRSRSLIQVTGVAKVWRSLTPLVLTRFPKRKGIAGSTLLVDGVEDQALRLLRQLPIVNWGEGDCVVNGEWLCWRGSDGAEVVRVRSRDRSVLDEDREELRYPALRFQRQRFFGNGTKSVNAGFWVEVKFAEAVQGPISLGYGAHFGLGVLEPLRGEVGVEEKGGGE